MANDSLVDSWLDTWLCLGNCFMGTFLSFFSLERDKSNLEPHIISHNSSFHCSNLEKKYWMGSRISVFRSGINDLPIIFVWPIILHHHFLSLL